MIAGSTSILILGAIVAVFGVLLLLVCRSACHIEGNPASYTRHSIEFSSAQKNELVEFLAGHSTHLDKKDGAGGLLLYVYTTKDSRAGSVDVPSGYGLLYEFSQYEYVPVGEPYALSAAQVDELLK